MLSLNEFISSLAIIIYFCFFSLPNIFSRSSNAMLIWSDNKRYTCLNCNLKWKASIRSPLSMALSLFSMDWEMFTIHVTKTYIQNKEILQVNKKKTRTLKKQIQYWFEQQFPKRTLNWPVNMKRYLRPLVIRQVQNKT